MSLDRGHISIPAARTGNPCLPTRIKFSNRFHFHCFCFDDSVSTSTPAARKRFVRSAMFNRNLRTPQMPEGIMPEEDNGNPSRTDR